MVSARRTSIAVRYLDLRQTSWALQANEGNFARLPGEPVGVVAQPCLGIFREEHGLAQPYPEPSHLPVHLDRRSSLGLVAGDQHFLQAPGMDEHIGDYRTYVARERFQMVGERKTDGLARLGHDVRRVDNRPGEARERLLDTGAEQSGDGAGEEAARAQDDHIRLLYGGNHAGWSCRARWFYLDPRDRLADLAHDGLAADDRPVGVRHHEGQALGRGRVDVTLYPQEAARLLHPLAEVPGHVRERRDDDVADAVVREVASPLKSVVEDLGQLLAAGECYQAVPRVTRRRYFKLLPQASARPPVVGDGNHRGEVPHPVPQAPEQHGQPRAAAERHYLEILMPTHRIQYIADRLQSVLTTRGDQTRCRIAAEMLEHARLGPVCAARSQQLTLTHLSSARPMCTLARTARSFRFYKVGTVVGPVSTTPNLSGPPSPLARLLILIAWRLLESPRFPSPGHAHGFREPPRVLDDLAAVATSDRRRG